MNAIATDKKETYYRCTHCGDEMYWNTGKRYTPCSCGALAIDGCEYYVRIIGNAESFQKIQK